MYMKIIHKNKYIIPQSESELCELSENSKIGVKTGLEKYFQF